MTRTALVSRLSVLALLTAPFTVAACSGGPTTSTPPPLSNTAAETAVETSASSADTATAEAAPRHGPGKWFFRQVAALDLRDEQRATLADIQSDLAADMAPHREALRQAALHFADALEAGQLDAEKAAEQKAALMVALAEANASFGAAINRVHDTLDGDQRVALVAALELHEGRAHDDAPKHGLAKMALVIGLSEAQQAQIKEAFSDGLDEIFPNRKARREAWQAKMKAMGEAFVTDDFDANDFNLAEHADEAVLSFVEIATRGVDVSNRVLSDGQRRLAADWMRSKLSEL
jgi:hypothetical protein